MGIVLKADFKTKLNSKLSRFNPKNTHQEYHIDIFSELFEFPQFKAHVAAYVERHYCVVVNDEDHPDSESLLEILKPSEVRMLNEWIVNRHNKPSVIKQEK